MVSGGSLSTVHDHAASGYLSAYDMSGYTPTISAVSQPSNGTLSLNSGGSFTYTPNSHYVGQDSFTFDASDPNGTSSTATETINVTNQAPMVSGGTLSTLHDHATSGYLSAYDGDGDPTTISAVAQPSNGTLTLNSGGSFTYTPKAGYVGTDSFTFKANDGITDSSIATETINVTNQAPVANDSSTTTVHDHAIYYANLYASDADGDQLTYSVVGQPSHGTLTMNNYGSYTYTPSQGYVGADSFTWKANDGIADSATATETINITNQVPVAVDGGVSTIHDQPVSGSLSAYDGDGDPTTISVVGQPSDGTVTLNGNSFTYTPNYHFIGMDSFTFTANDGVTDSVTATETINVTDNFVAGEVDASDFSTPYAPQSVDINLLSDYSDSPGGNVVLVSEGTPSQGTLTDKGNGVVTYTPDETKPMVGKIQFAYTIFDGIMAATSICVIDLADVTVNLQLRQSGTFSPDNMEAAAAEEYSGTSELGPIHPGNGPLDSVLQEQYVSQIEVVGTVPKGSEKLQFNWNVTIQQRVWSITNNEGQEWEAAPFKDSSQGFPNPVDDTPNQEFMNTNVSDSQHIFMSDTSGISLNSDLNIGDYIRSEKNFIFTVTVTDNGVTKVAGVLNEYQIVVAQREWDTGTISNDWSGIENSYTQGSSTCAINAGDVDTTVGGTNLPIFIDPDANT